MPVNKGKKRVASTEVGTRTGTVEPLSLDRAFRSLVGEARAVAAGVRGATAQRKARPRPRPVPVRLRGSP